MKDILERIKLLIIKLISVKGLVFGIACFFLINEYIAEDTWWITAGLIIGGRAIEKIKGK